MLDITRCVKRNGGEDMKHKSLNGYVVFAANKK